MRLQCFICDKFVSGEIPETTTIRAVIICPECYDEINKQWEHLQLLKILRTQ
jgi:uncharacterized protein YlaI